MDSLLANYASDEEEEEEEKDTLPASKPTVKPLSLPPPNPSKTSSLFSSLTSPDASKASSVFSSLPPPKSTIFSSLPPPKSHSSKPPKPPSSDPTPKRVIQFKPPLDPSLLKSQDPDVEDDEKPAKPTKEAPSQNQNDQQKSLFSILPPPKNSLCLAPPRKSTVESAAPVAISDASRLATDSYISSPAAPLQTGKEFVANNVNYGNFQGHSIDQSLGMGNKNYGNFEGNSADGSLGPGNENYGNYVNYGGHEGNLVDGSLPTSSGSYGNYENYGSYESNWGDGSGTMGSGPSVPVDSIGRVMGKRGRNETPLDIVEVKQDELMSNRPREDQVKLTGIAFGPSYQPVSTKGKPSKLHKRKHQIGSLYYDMKQKEMELTERRARGLLTKTETQAKYGW